MIHERPGARRRLHLFLLLAASLLVPAMLFGAYAKQSRDQALADAEENLRRRAAVLAEHVARVFDIQAMIIEVVEGRLAGRDFAALDNDTEIPALLREQALHSAIITSLLVLDNDGTILAASLDKAEDLNSATRDYFLGAMGGVGLHLGEPLIGRVSGRRVLSLSRRRAEGGVIAVTLDVGYFADVFASLPGDAAADGPVALFRADGRQLARWPELDRPADLPSGRCGLIARMPAEIEGTYRAVPTTGGGEHLFGFHKVPGYPAWVTHGRALAAIRGHWVRAVVPQAILSLAAAVLLATASVWVLHRERRAAATEARLQRVVAERTAEAEQRAAEASDAATARELALRAAQRADEAKNHFLASASHDLRQPIQGLRLFLDVLDRRLADDEDRRVLTFAVKALEGAEELLSTLLDVSTLEAGMVSALPSDVALGPVLDGLIDEFAPQAAAGGLGLRYVRSSQWVHTDPILLTRVLRSLLANAVRYTKSGGVLLGCRRHGRHLRVEVWDTGPGIPPDKLDAVFDDFVQLGNSERDRSKGLGLGLAVARRVAVLMGHRMGVSSHEGRGAMFWVELPLVVPNLAATSEESALIPL